MSKSAVRTTATIVYNVLVATTVGYLAFRYYASVPRDWHAAVLGASAALMTVLLVLSTQVFGKFDRILQDGEKFEMARVRRLYRYIHVSRRRLVLFLFATAAFGVMNTAIAILLVKATALSVENARWITATGYFAAAGIVLYAVRITHAYLSVDRFRLELFSAIRAEEEREKALLELRPSVLTEFPEEQFGVTGQRRQTGPTR